MGWNELSPWVVDDSDERFHEAIPPLRRALKRARRGELRVALDEIDRARRRAPDFHEIDRVEAYAVALNDPAQATDLYQRAFHLAPDERAQARVAYFLAEHLANHGGSLSRAEELARLAHSQYASPSSASRLGQVLTYRRSWDEAAELVREAMTGDDDRLAVIARTQFVELVRRRIEHLVAHEDDGVSAARIGHETLVEMLAYVGTGPLDGRLYMRILKLAAETLWSSRAARRLDEIQAELLGAMSALSSRPGAALAYLDADVLGRRLEAISRRPDAPSELRDAAKAFHRRLAGARRDPPRYGTVKSFSGAKGYGFISGAPREEVFFHRTVLPDQADEILLVPRAPVAFERGDLERPKHVTKVVPALPAADADGFLRQRRAIVSERHGLRCVVHDDDTGLKVVVYERSFEEPSAFRRLTTKDIVRLDYERTARGARAKDGTARVVATSAIAAGRAGAS